MPAPQTGLRPISFAMAQSAMESSSVGWKLRAERKVPAMTTWKSARAQFQISTQFRAVHLPLSKQLRPAGRRASAGLRKPSHAWLHRCRSAPPPVTEESVCEPAQHTHCSMNIAPESPASDLLKYRPPNSLAFLLALRNEF